MSPPLIGYSCEDFPSKTTQNSLAQSNQEIRLEIWPKNYIRFKFGKKISMTDPAAK